MGKAKYQVQWKKDIFKKSRPIVIVLFVKNVFSVLGDGSGICQVLSHAKCHKNEKPFNQSTIAVGNDDVALNKPEKHVLTPGDQVIKAEVLQELNYVGNNYFFASAENDNNFLRAMFPDSSIAKFYEMSSAKLQYIIEFGIFPYVKGKLIYIVKNTPYTFNFDETTNRQVQK